LTAPKATDEELVRAHAAEYISAVGALYRPGVTTATSGGPAEARGDALIISGDVYCNQHTSLAARTAAGCAVEVRQPSRLRLSA
jgi:acetoin utilization deacetylase AcuC-like enzyme